MTVEPDARDSGCRTGQLASGQSEAAIPISRFDVPQGHTHRNGRSNEGGHEPLCKRVGARCANDARANSRKCNAEAFRIGKVDPGGQALLQFDSHGRIGTEEIFHGRLTRQSLVAPAIEIRQRHETMSTRNSRSASFLVKLTYQIDAELMAAVAVFTPETPQ